MNRHSQFPNQRNTRPPPWVVTGPLGAGLAGPGGGGAVGPSLAGTGPAGPAVRDGATRPRLDGAARLGAGGVGLTGIGPVGGSAGARLAGRGFADGSFGGGMTADGGGLTAGGAGTGGIAGVTPGLVRRVQRRLAAVGAAATDHAGLRMAVTEALGEDGIVLPPATLAPVVRAVGDELTGLGPLAPLLADPAVTDVLVNGPDDVWVERAGGI